MIEVVIVGVLALAAGTLVGWRARGARAGQRRQSDLDRTRSELTRRLNELFSFQELSYVLADSVHVDRVAQQAAEYVARFIECDGTVVALASEDRTTLRIVEALGTLAELAGLETNDPEQIGLIGDALSRERLTVVSMEDGKPPVLFGGVSVQQAALVPLRAHGVTGGVLAVVRESDMQFRREDLRLLSTAGTHTALALANARFVELIRAGKEQWETTFDALAEGIAVVDQENCIRRANRALADLLQQPLPDVIGIDLCSALVSDATQLSELLDATRSEAKPPSLTSRSDLLDRTLRITVSPMGGDLGEGWVVALIEDVTEQEALQGQLIQSEKMAAVGHLVSGVAHELNNPLTSISGLSEFLAQRSSTPKQDREHLVVIQEQAERAARIVRNLLTFVRKGPTDLRDVDLNKVVQQSTSLIRYELTLRKIDLNMALGENLPLIRGDRYQIQQVVLNLLTNAVQALRDNPSDLPRAIRIGTSLEDGDVVLRIADSGPGIPEDLLPKVFDPFFTTKEPGRGTGLGLWVTFRIVEGHGGSIEAHRASEGGVEFTIALPPTARSADTTQKADGAATSTRPSGAREAVEQPRKGCRILLVDEDPAIRRMIDVLFSQDGQEVQAAQGATHALELLERTTYDMILADARAAVSGTETFAEVLCARHPQLQPRTVFFTADVRPETDEWLRQLGCRYFRKPFNARELRAAAAEILAR